MFYDAADRQRVAVVGSGISGLAAAFALENAGYDVDLIEREDRLGGRFGVATLGERPVMMGGKNIGRKYSSFRAFTSALGSHPYEEFGINSSRVKDGQVQTFDSSRVAKSLRNVFKAGSPRDLGRVAGLAMRVKADDANRFLDSPLFTRLADRNDDAPLSAHFGPDITRYLLRPMTVRMNGAEPDEVYLGTLGTNLALILDTFDQLVRGIQPVLDAMARRVTVRLGSHVEGLIVEDGRVAGLRIAQNGSPTAERYDGVVVAAPALAAADVLRSELPELSRRLGEVRYFPTTVALVEYDRPVFTPEVRAIAMDDGPCSNAGAYGQEDRHIVRYTFSGRQARTPEPSQDQIEEWIGVGEERLHSHVPTSRRARRVRSVNRHWARGYCGYLPFHGAFLSAVRGEVAAVSGLELSGDYLLGVSIEACFRSGEQAAARLAQQTSGVRVA
ncbi:MAG: protoporphyrinogen/coproporphyrinogen oxidase [Solirubrobacteraceae bacterium]|nr:protoporphyrinogen/coproporphyrinogen oxidase [Solirubrobacteraceae bacterium]